jgi:3-keto-5-aminohexanoate cleavage enzyme
VISCKNSPISKIEEVEKMDKLIITVALTGNVPTQQMNPNLPVTADEIAADVRRCADAGAVVFHVHARDKDQKPTFDIDVFKASAHRIKKAAPEVIIQLSTGARAGKDWEARANPVRLLPEMASFTTGSNNLPGINAVYLQNKGFIEPPLHFDFVLGAPGSMAGTVKNLVFLSESIPAGSTWTVAGIGKAEIPLAAAAIAMGGHVRVGLEDNLYLPDGSPASNPKLVEKVVAIAKEIGREIAAPDEARSLLSLNPRFKDRILI